MIPAWNLAGIIPPIMPGQPGHSGDRSPYVVPLVAVVDRFATSVDRRNILDGLLSYRAALHNLGITSGFQWLDGSFLEDIEAHESRPPMDVDVVTYFHLPAGETQVSLAKRANALFDNVQVKKSYSVDAYTSVLGGTFNESVIRRVAYWYSMWSHRRDGTWKGFIQIDLSPSEDLPALASLASISPGGIAP